jgi:Gamma tubulin complex component C-terminal
VLSGTVRTRLDTAGFRSTVQKFGTNFDEFLKQFIQKLWSNSVQQEGNSHLGNLVERLDYNRFFREKYATASDAQF